MINLLYLLVLNGVMVLSSIAQAGQTVHIGNVTIVNGKVVSENSSNNVQGSGVSGRETRSLEFFNEVQISISANVSVIKGANSACVISGDANILPLITTKIYNGVLTISNSQNFSSKSPLELQIVVPELSKFVMEGSGNIAINDANEQSLELTISGSGNMRASGRTGELTARISGAGNMDLSALHARKARAELEGAGNIRVFASEEFSGSISGSGDIKVSGHPQIMKAAVNGAGRISPE